MAGNWYNHGEMRRWFCSSSRLRSSTFWLFSGSEDDARMTNSSRASDWYPYLMVRCLESQIAVGPVLPIRFGLSWLSLASLYVSLSFFLFLLLSFSIYSNKYLFFFTSIIQIKIMTNLSVVIRTTAQVIRSCLYYLDFVPWLV